MGQLPDIAGHVEQAIAVGRKAAHRRAAVMAVLGHVLQRERALPVVGHRLALGVTAVLVVAPGVVGIFEPAARGVLPFGFAGQVLSGPARIGHRVLEGDVHHRVVGAPAQAAAGPAGCAPGGARRPGPPLADVGHALDLLGLAEHQRAGPALDLAELRELPGVERALGHGKVAGAFDEGGELRVGDLVTLDVEGRDLGRPARFFLGIEALGAHQEAAPAHGDHAGRHTAGLADGRGPAAVGLAQALRALRLGTAGRERSAQAQHQGQRRKPLPHVIGPRTLVCVSR